MIKSSKTSGKITIRLYDQKWFNTPLFLLWQVFVSFFNSYLCFHLSAVKQKALTSIRKYTHQCIYRDPCMINHFGRVTQLHFVYHTWIVYRTKSSFPVYQTFLLGGPFQLNGYIFGSFEKKSLFTPLSTFHCNFQTCMSMWVVVLSSCFQKMNSTLLKFAL